MDASAEELRNIVRCAVIISKINYSDIVGLSSNSKKYKDDENDAERIEVVKDDDDLTMKQVRNDYDTAAQMRQLRNCNTFAEVQTLCSELSTASSLDGKDRYVLDDRLLVDEPSIDLYPDDVPNDTNYFPVSVRANGDCLPACESVFLYGTDVYPEEVRLKIIQELVLHKDSYLNAIYLSRGLENPCRNILKSYAMYSDEYEHGTVLTDRVIEDIFEQELMKVRKSKSDRCLHCQVC
ncbi:unnamed protein product [Mytilus edulis]|uniref:Uncharacterized protein n=1 Tax=Mytilus edulis TaxID=6550 RepID=A0A8S3PSM1_MYTED|nr:unnamed protein product [Mytilus edulis]